MLQSAIILVVCLLLGMAGLAVCAWAVVTGQLFTLDGLLLVSVSLLLSGLFVGNVAWSVYTGEVRAVLNQLRESRQKPKS